MCCRPVGTVVSALRSSLSQLRLRRVDLRQVSPWLPLAEHTVHRALFAQRVQGQRQHVSTVPRHVRRVLRRRAERVSELRGRAPPARWRLRQELRRRLLRRLLDIPLPTVSVTNRPRAIQPPSRPLVTSLRVRSGERVASQRVALFC